MSDELNKEFSKGKGLLKDMVQESGYLYDALMSIGTNIAESIDNFTEGVEGARDTSEALANVYKKDIVNSVKKAARNTEKLVDLQTRINKGQNVSKQINEALIKNQSKRQVLAQKILMARKNGLPIDVKEISGLNTQLKINKVLLESLKEQNTENQKGVSIYKIAGEALGGMADKLDKTGTLSGILKGNFKEVVTVQRLGQLSAVGLLKSFIDGILMIDKIQTQYNKEFGLTDAHADSIQDRMSDIADSSGKVSINFLDTNKALMGIAETTGILATGLRDDVIGGAAELQKLLGLSAKGMTMLAFNAQVTGQSMEEQTKSITKGVHQTEAKLGFHMQEKKIIQEVSELTGLIRANLGRNVQAMGAAVSKAKAFGLTLQDLAGISSNMLNFQSSIEAELTAELFIGKQLNLEKARLYALTGDYSKLQDEIVKNVGSEYEFLTMNVLAKEKYAAALGMSVDQMSNLVMKNADLAALRRDATAAGDQDTLNMLNQRDLSEKMADIMTKLQTTFVSIAEGPIGALVEGIGSMLENTTMLYGILGLVAAVKIGGLISGIASLGAAFGVAGVGALTLMSAATLGLGIAAVAAGIYFGTSVMNKEKKKASTVKRYNTLGATEMVSLDRGSAIFDQGESVVRTDNFAKLTDGINELIGVTQQQKLSFVVEGHHGTRYR